MASSTVRRGLELQTEDISLDDGSEETGVRNFGMLIDTHRDVPHVPTFSNDIHRGWCRPTLVHWQPPAPDTLAVEPDHMGFLFTQAGGWGEVHLAHRFITNEWWGEYVLDYVMDHGKTPTDHAGDENGSMPTKFLRDPRGKVYLLRSFRQMVLHHQELQKGAPSRTPA